MWWIAAVIIAAIVIIRLVIDRTGAEVKLDAKIHKPIEHRPFNEVSLSVNNEISAFDYNDPDPFYNRDK